MKRLITDVSELRLKMQRIAGSLGGKSCGDIAMNHLYKLLVPVILATLPIAASADPWKDESGHGKGRGHERREFKEEFWDGNCKVERKLEKSGEYKEERKCKAPRTVYYEPAPVYVPAVPAQPAVVVQPGITIHGSVRIPQ